MRGTSTSIRPTIILAIFATLAAMSTGPAAAQTESVLYSFGQNNEYWGPYFPPVVGPGGTLYGTIVFDDNAYQLAPSGGGTWNEALIANLPSPGSSPDGAQLAIDSVGNLYGVTSSGGEFNGGTVFELSPGPAGWTETILHSFSYNGKDGNNPEAGLILDSVGNLYGTTAFGGGSGAMCGTGQNGCGTVFELSPIAGKGWKETILHRFLDKDEDGEIPEGTLVIDAAGNLYGTTSEGGYSWGVVFELTPADGGWREKILHRFSYFNSGADGKSPSAGLVLDANGNLFGTTSGGGVFAKGTAFEVSPTANGVWLEKTIHNFGNGVNGSPSILGDGLVVDSADNLYGTTWNGGSYHNGAVFELSPSANGSWTEKILHSFEGSKSSDGATPYTGLVFGPSGTLYGVTYYGGTYDAGTVFEVIP